MMNNLVVEKSCCDFSLKLKKKRRGFRFLKLQFRIKCGGAQDVCGCISRNVPARYTMCIKLLKKKEMYALVLNYKKRRE